VSEETAEELTIDELAQRTGLTVRSVRAHQSRGLLPAPTVRARTGYYGPDHVARLRLIAEMQADGYNLKAIRRLLGGDSDEHVLGFVQAALAPFENERPEVIDATELAERFNRPPQDKTLAKAERLGIVVPLGEGRYEVPSPILFRAGQEVVDLGVDIEEALRVVEQVKRHAEGVAQVFVRLFLERVWKPFEEAGHPPEQWPEIRQTIERLRPLASEALLSVFQRTMTEAVEEGLGKALGR